MVRSDIILLHLPGQQWGPPLFHAVALFHTKEAAWIADVFPFTLIDLEVAYIVLAAR